MEGISEGGEEGREGGRRRERWEEGNGEVKGDERMRQEGRGRAKEGIASTTSHLYR